MKNHTLRVITAVIAIPPIIFICMLGGVYFFFFITIISTLALLEFYNLAKAKGALPMKLVGNIVGFFVLFSFISEKIFKFINAQFFESQGFVFPSHYQLVLIVLLTSIVILSLIELFRQKGSAILNLSVTLFGIVYIPFFFGTLIGIRELFHPPAFPLIQYFSHIAVPYSPEIINQVDQWGGYTIITLFASIWISDSAAYYVGSFIGKHKLFLRVSPNKSWEGAIAGFVFAVASVVIAKYLLLDYLTLLQALIIGIIIGTAGQLGDLIESLFKRDSGVKDSSGLIPGHGGVFDRFDSLLLVSPIVYLYLDFIVFS